MLPLRAEIRRDFPAVERRNAVRRILRLDVSACPSSDAIPALVYNLSETGLLIQCFADIEVGETLHVDLTSAGMSEAQVVWSSGGLFGCEFISPLCSKSIRAALLPKPSDEQKRIHREKAQHCQRKSARSALHAEVTLRRPCQSKYSVTIHDASPYGCKIDFVERPNVGDGIWVRFGELESVAAIVCWVDGFVAGVQFERPIHPAVFDRLLHKLREAG